VFGLAESMVTKLPHYTLPAIPALSFLTADAILRLQRRKKQNLPGIKFAIFTGLWMLLGIALLGVFWIPIRYFRNDFPLTGAILLTIAGAAYLGLTGYCILKNR